MNHDAERSSNVLIDDTPSAGLLKLCASGTSRVHEWRTRPDSPTRRLLRGLLRTIHGAFDEGRNVLEKLSPSSVPSTRLEHAFVEILDEIARDARPRFRIVVTGQPKALSSAIEQHVYMIQREALVNAIRHSDATSIEAELDYFPRRLRVVIRDNGRGFEPKGLKSGRGPCCGLRTMVEQAKAMGARLEIWSKPRCGTEVELSLPFDPRSMPVPNP